MARGRCYIGTSGWSYKHWRGPFYPSGMAKGAEQLCFYAERFDTVEVNGTFYRLIEADTFRRWREETPKGFVFACKGSRYLTHMKRLKDPEQGVARFFERVEALGDKLGPIVFQLPGRFKPDRERLARVPRRPAAPAPLRLRVPRPGLVPARDLRRAREARCRALPVRVRRAGGAARGDRKLRLHPPARPRRALPGLLRRRGASDLGEAHRAPGPRRVSTSTATSTTTTAPSRPRTPCVCVRCSQGDRWANPRGMNLAGRP